MENLTITTLENDDVVVSYDYRVWEDNSVEHVELKFTTVGSYVFRICDNGSLHQVCEGLAFTGPTLMLSGSLENTLKKTLA